MGERNRRRALRVAFRVDASVDLGAGHLVRCLALARRLKASGAEAVFLCRRARGDLSGFVRSAGFRLVQFPPIRPAARAQRKEAELCRRLRPAPDWLVVDHYSLDGRWERAVRPWAKRILVIDDLADRAHDCDLLVDENLHPAMERRYRGLLPPRCRILLGPRHALLREEFLALRPPRHVRRGPVRRLFVSFGGSDPSDETSKTLRAMRGSAAGTLRADVVVGPAHPRKRAVRALCRTLPRARYHCAPRNFAALMAESDLAIGGGGISVWERCCLGLPSLTVVAAENQWVTTRFVARAGATELLGWREDVREGEIRAALERRLRDTAGNRRMGERAYGMMEGHTGAAGVARLIREWGD